MSLRGDLAGLDDLGRAVALIAWSTGVPETAPWMVVAAGGLPTLTSAFFAPLPATLQLDLLADGFAVEGRGGRQRPIARTYAVRDDGSVWLDLPDGRSELCESSVAVLLLNTVLHWIRLHARASLRLEFEANEQLDEYVRQFELFHRSMNHRLGVVGSSWIAGVDVIGSVNEAGWTRPRPTVELLGHSRAAVEQERREGGPSQGWVSVERAMEPETDNWSPPYVPFPGHGPRQVTGLDDILGDAVGVRALERFLDAWYGIELPPAPDHDERPATLARLAQIPNIGALFRDGHLLSTGTIRQARRRSSSGCTRVPRRRGRSASTSPSPAISRMVATTRRRALARERGRR